MCAPTATMRTGVAGAHAASWGTGPIGRRAAPTFGCSVRTSVAASCASAKSLNAGPISVMPAGRPSSRQTWRM